MVNQRQRLARKRHREANPELFPKVEPTPPKDPDKKKKKSMFKGKKVDSKDPRRHNKSGFRKHPLRVPGMRPGDNCFICKAQDHIAKNCPQKAQWEKNKICLLCRHRGHTLKNCPDKSNETVENKLCYNCGETGHSLAKCPQPLQDGGTKFASCFICNDHGHLSKNCPKNTHGIYPKGGCCKVCGGVSHLAKDCPNKSSKVTISSNVGKTSLQERPRGKVTKFFSGDDLEDDFMVDTHKPDEEQTYLKDAADAKQKKKKGPKVVNF